MGYRLVDKLVAENHRLVGIACGNLLPYVAELLLGTFALEEPRISVAVVDIVAGLAAGSVVHVENEVEIVCPAPFHNAVDALVSFVAGAASHIIVVGKQLVVEGQADSVCSGRRYEVDVGAGDVIILEIFPKIGGGVLSHHLAEHVVYHSGGICFSETEHISFGIEPVAEVCSPDEQLRAVGAYQVVALDADECFGRVSRRSS